MWRMRQSPHLLCLSCHPPEKESSDVARRRLPVGTAGEKVACSPAVQTSDLSCSRLQQIVSSEARPPPPQKKKQLAVAVMAFAFVGRRVLRSTGYSFVSGPQNVLVKNR